MGKHAFAPGQTCAADAQSCHADREVVRAHCLLQLKGRQFADLASLPAHLVPHAQCVAPVLPGLVRGRVSWSQESYLPRMCQLACLTTFLCAGCAPTWSTWRRCTCCWSWPPRSSTPPPLLATGALTLSHKPFWSRRTSYHSFCSACCSTMLTTSPCLRMLLYMSRHLPCGPAFCALFVALQAWPWCFWPAPGRE